MKADYDATAAAWADAPASVYARFAAAMLAHPAVEVSGARVLDVGAGTAVASDAALMLGAARAVASDISLEMLHRRTPSIPAVAANAMQLPFADATFDLVVSAFSLGHLDDPAVALAEWRRVAPSVLVSTFAPGPPHPAKEAVTATVKRFGFVPPPWHQRLTAQLEPRVEDPASLAALAKAAGYTRIDVTSVGVDTGLRSPEEIVDWRFGMANVAPFIAGLPAARRGAVRRAAEEAVAGLAPVTVDIQVLSAH